MAKANRRSNVKSGLSAEAKLGQAKAEYKKATRTSMCFASEFDEGQCSSRIINAHAVQRTGVLSRVAEGGHVMQGIMEEGSINLKKIGVRKASTFRGFCEFHDSALFLPLDTRPFTGSREQAFLLCLRALAHERHKKIGVNIGFPSVEEAMRSPEVDNTIGARILGDYRTGTMIGTAEMQRECSRAWTMLERTPATHRLLSSAKRLDEQSAHHAILRFVLTYSEDCYFSPVFYRELEQSKQQWISKRLAMGTGMNMYNATHLLEDNVRIVPWRVKRRIVLEPKPYSR